MNKPLESAPLEAALGNRASNPYSLAHFQTLMSQRSSASILIVEDDPQQVWLYTKALRGYRLTCVATGSAALREVAVKHPDLIILDHILGDGELGAEFLPKLKAAAAHIPIIVISGTLDIAGKLKALQGPLSAHYVIEKPVDLDELEDTVQIALEQCCLGETVKVLQSLEKAERLDATVPEHQFTERLGRQHDLLNRLRATDHKPNITALAGDYHVSRKTIIRDLQDLVKRGQLDSSIYPEPLPPAKQPPHPPA
jgi:CheY-like chemotaxis protein